MQARAEDRTAGLGETAQEIAEYLASWDAPWFESSRVAEHDGKIVGFAAAELDESLGRAWIYGPLVDDPEWDGIAEHLFRDVVATMPSTTANLELSGDVANVRLARLADRHGLTAGVVHFVLTLDSLAIELLRAQNVPSLTTEDEDTFVALHDDLFPGTYYPGRQLLTRAAEGKQIILGLVDRGELIGYASGRIDEGGDGYIDFIGVAPPRRREGHGRSLVVTLCHALQPVPRVSLTVSEENIGALALYDTLGFERTSSAVGYRRRAEPGA